MTRTEAINVFNQIEAEPIATIRKFKLRKVFFSLLPPKSEELSAKETAEAIRKMLPLIKA